MIRVRWTIDYSAHPHDAALEWIPEDREVICQYGAIVDEKTAGPKHVYLAEYVDEDGWEARGPVEETHANLGSTHASWERID